MLYYIINVFYSLLYYQYHQSKIIIVGVLEGLDLGGHHPSIFPVHQLCVGHQD